MAEVGEVSEDFLYTVGVLALIVLLLWAVYQTAAFVVGY